MFLQQPQRQRLITLAERGEAHHVRKHNGRKAAFSSELVARVHLGLPLANG
jgi:hypothetical protein